MVTVLSPNPYDSDDLASSVLAIASPRLKTDFSPIPFNEGSGLWAGAEIPNMD